MNTVFAAMYGDWPSIHSKFQATAFNLHTADSAPTE